MTDIKNLTTEAAAEAVRWYFAPVVAFARRARAATTRARSGAKPSNVLPAEESDTQRPVWRVNISPLFEQSAKAIQLSPEISRTLTFLILRLSYSASAISPIPGTDVRVLSSGRRIALSDGTEMAPIAIFYTLRDRESTVEILDFMPLAPDEIESVDGTLSKLLTENVRNLRAAPAHHWLERSVTASPAPNESVLGARAAQLVRSSTSGSFAEVVEAAVAETAA